MFEWIYAQPVNVFAIYHIISKGGYIRPIKFWWDIRKFDRHEMQLTGLHNQITARLFVFQDCEKEVPGRPIVWSLIQLSAENEFEATVLGSSLAHEHCARITFLTSVPFRTSGQPRIVQLDSTEFGWLPHFEDSEFKGIDLHQGALVPSPEDPNIKEAPVIRREPLHIPVVGTVKNDDILHIGFTDTIRQIDRNTEVDVGRVRIPTTIVDMGLKKTDQTTPNALLTRVCTFYSSALAQNDPSNQFILLWAAVETLVNSEAGQPMLNEISIKSALDSIDARELDKPRIEQALGKITQETYKQRIATSFKKVFGECLEGTEKKIADLRPIRGKLLHPQVKQTVFTTDLIKGLLTLRETIENHLEIVRSSLHNTP